MRHPRTTLATATAGLTALFVLACGGDGDGGNGMTPPQNTAPSASISGPDDEANFDEGASITFTGSATDTEDGALTGSSLVWESDVDGQIGTGESVSASDLSVGHHIVTLTATDSEGATATAQRGVRVRTPNQAITVDLSIGDNFFEDLQGRQNEESFVQIRLGDQLRWTNNGNNPHTVTSGEQSDCSSPTGGAPQGGTRMNSGTVSSGGTFTYQPDAEGVWTYCCEIHPNVMVEATFEVVQ